MENYRKVIAVKKLKELKKSVVVKIAVIVFIIGIFGETGWFLLEPKYEKKSLQSEIVELVSLDETKEKFTIGFEKDGSVQNYIIGEKNGNRLSVPFDVTTIQYLEVDTEAKPTAFINYSSSGKIEKCDLFLPNGASVKE